MATLEKLNGERTWVTLIADSNGQVVRYKCLPIPVCSASTSFMTMMDIAYDPVSDALLAFGIVQCPNAKWMLVKMDTTMNIQ